MILLFVLGGKEMVYSQTLIPSLIMEQVSGWNPASLARIKNSSIVAASERRYLLKELNTYLLSATFLHSSGNFAFTGSYAGFAGYRESLLSVSYGRKMGKSIDLGLRFNYFKFSLGGLYGSSGTIGIVFGTLWHIHEKIYTGIAVSKPAAPRYEWKIGYDASDQFSLNFVVIKEEGRLLNVNGNFKYSPVSNLSFKAGIFTVNASPWFSASFVRKQMSIEILAAWHAQLGISPAMMISFEQKKKLHATE